MQDKSLSDEQLFENEEHYVESHTSRYFQTVVEVWCPQVDESKGILGDRYFRHCPMCGDTIEDAD